MPNQFVSLARDVYALPSGPLSVSSSRECSKETTRLEGESAFSCPWQPGYIAWTSETPGRGIDIAAQSSKSLGAQTWQPAITSPFPLTGLGPSPKDTTSLFWGKVCLCSLDWPQIHHTAMSDLFFVRQDLILQPRLTTNSLCKLGRPHTYSHSSALVSWMLRLLVHTSMLSYAFHFQAQWPQH